MMDTLTANARYERFQLVGGQTVLMEVEQRDGEVWVGWVVDDQGVRTGQRQAILTRDCLRRDILELSGDRLVPNTRPLRSECCAAKPQGTLVNLWGRCGYCGEAVNFEPLT